MRESLTETLAEKIEKLNHRAEAKKYTIDALDWDHEIDFSKNWSPTEMVSLEYLPSYSLLNDEQKRFYNQIFAISICEQFIWLENNLLRGILIQEIDEKKYGEGFHKALHFFLEEEDKHSEMFWRILEKARPEWYPTREFKIYKINPIQTKFFDMICNNPNTFIVWVWLALFFEERTLDYSLQYQRAYKGKEAETQNIDKLFYEIHYYHMLDEVRHHQMDECFLEAFYDKQPKWKKKLAGYMFNLIIKAYIAPKRNAKVMLDMLGEDYPELVKNGAIDKLKSELPTLRQNEKFQKLYFGEQAVGKTLQLASTKSEFDAIWKHFLHYDKTSFSS